MTAAQVRQQQQKSRFPSRAPRFASDLPVEARTFGSTYGCKLIAINVSLTGLLVAGQADILPFRHNTLIELTMDPQAAYHFAVPLTCIGKVTRYSAFKEGPGEPWHKKIGICFTEFSDHQLATWVEYVLALEELEPAQSDEPDEDVEEPAIVIAKSFQSKALHFSGARSK